MRQVLLSLFRYRRITLLNLLGLSIAYVAFILLVIQVRYEYSFDKFHQNADRIFRIDKIDMDNTEKMYALHSPRFINSIIHSYPEIEAGAIYYSSSKLSHISIVNDNKQEDTREIIHAASPGVVDVFDYTIIEGDKNALNAPAKAMIPESMARRMFGNKSAINQVIYVKDYIWITDQKEFTIGAVYKDFPKNSQLDNVIITSLSENRLREIGDGGNFLFYALLDNKQSAGKIADQYNSTAKEEYGMRLGIKFFALPDIYYEPIGFVAKSGNKKTTYILSLIAFLVILIASINFVNFSTATASIRLNNINIRKVLGCPVSQLRKALLLESILTCALSYLIAVFVVWILGETHVLSFIDADITLANNVPVILYTLIIALVVGVLASLYPAYYLTSFPPALVLKGSFGFSPAGRRLRTLLIGVQYVISIALIIVFITMQLQNNYMHHYNPGFDKDHVAIVELNSRLLDHKEEYINKLKEYAEIEDVAFAKWRMGAHDGYTTYSLEYNGETAYFYTFEVTPNFLDVMNIPIVEGRNFLPEDESRMVFIFNEKMRGALPLTIGDEPTWVSGRKGKVLGYAGEVKATSLRKEEDPIVFMIHPGVSLPISYIKIKAGSNPVNTVKHIQHVLKSIDDSYPFEIEFYEELYQTLYQKEIRLNKIIFLFSLLAILIATIGVFGLVLFETQYRKKEIGIRKINGASITDILALFAQTYVRIVCICFIIAAPIAYFAVSKWLESFAYKTPVYWWIFLIAFAVVTLITLVTVIVQNWRTANANPMEVLKS